MLFEDHSCCTWYNFEYSHSAPHREDAYTAHVLSPEPTGENTKVPLGSDRILSEHNGWRGEDLWWL